MTIPRFDDILFDNAVFDGLSAAVSNLYATITGGRNARTLVSSATNTHALACSANMSTVVITGGLSMTTQHLNTNRPCGQIVTLEVDA